MLATVDSAGMVAPIGAAAVAAATVAAGAAIFTTATDVAAAAAAGSAVFIFSVPAKPFVCAALALWP